MSDTVEECHPSDEELRSLVTAPGAADFERLLHLATCAPCRNRLNRQGPAYERWLRGLWGPADTERHEHSEIQVGADVRKALPAYLALDHLPASQWALHVGNRPQYRGAAIGLLLLDLAAELRPSSRAASEALVRAVQHQLHDADLSDYRTALLAARTDLHLGNLYRLRGQFEAAQENIDRAICRLGTCDDKSLLVLAEAMEIQGALRRDQGLWDPAVSVLEAAAALYLESGAPVGRQIRPVLLLGTVNLYLDRYAEAATQFGEAVAALHPQRDQYLYISARQSLALCWANLGQTDDARLLLPEIRSLVAGLRSRILSLRCTWLEALIAEKDGSYLAAAQLYREAQAGFLDVDSPFDAALVSLELAALHLRHDQPVVAAQVALEAFPVFESLDVEREALTNILLLVKAVRRQLAGEAAVREALASLRRAGRRAT